MASVTPIRKNAMPISVNRSPKTVTTPAQMIVVGTRGRGGFTRLLLGSTSSALLDHCSSPVAVVRDPTQRALWS